LDNSFILDIGVAVLFGDGNRCLAEAQEQALEILAGNPVKDYHDPRDHCYCSAPCVDRRFHYFLGIHSKLTL
jgi:hypothetical protein